MNDIEYQLINVEPADLARGELHDVLNGCVAMAKASDVSG